MTCHAADVAAAMDVRGLRPPLPEGASWRRRQERLVFVLQVCAGHVHRPDPLPDAVAGFLAAIGTDPTWEAVQDRLDKERHILDHPPVGGAL